MTAPNFEGHWHLRVRLDPWRACAAAAGCGRATDCAAGIRPRKISWRACAACAPGSRRQGAHRLERTHDPRHGRRRPAAGSRGLRSIPPNAPRDSSTASCGEGWSALASWRADAAKLPAYLDDHAFLLAGLLELLQAAGTPTGSPGRRHSPTPCSALSKTRSAAVSGSPPMTNRHRCIAPRASAMNPCRREMRLPPARSCSLGHLCAEPRYIHAAERALKAALPSATHYPDGHLSTFTALSDAIQPPMMIILRGSKTKLQQWQTVLNETPGAHRIMLAIPNDAAGLTGLLAQCVPQGELCAYVCHGTHCSLPVTSLTELLKTLPS